MKRTGPTNKNLVILIDSLKALSIKENAPIWKRIARELEKPTRNKKVINIYKINKLIKEGETVATYAKVLGVGEFDKKANVCAFNFSKDAKNKINKNGKAITFEELMKSNPKGKGVRILG